MGDTKTSSTFITVLAYISIAVVIVVVFKILTSSNGKQKGNTKKPNHSNAVFKNFGIAVGIVAVLGLGAAGWIGISNWLEDKKEEDRNNHLNEVLVECTNRESSSKCKSLQQKYDITFKYCYAMGDMDNVQTGYLPNGEFKIIMPPKRAVVWEGNSLQPPEHTYSIGDTTTKMPSAYYSCTDHQE